MESLLLKQPRLSDESEDDAVEEAIGGVVLWEMGQALGPCELLGEMPGLSPAIVRACIMRSFSFAAALGTEAMASLDEERRRQLLVVDYLEAVVATGRVEAGAVQLWRVMAAALLKAIMDAAHGQADDDVEEGVDAEPPLIGKVARFRLARLHALHMGRSVEGTQAKHHDETAIQVSCSSLLNCQFQCCAILSE
jgi:hypothetical protein